ARVGRGHADVGRREEGILFDRESSDHDHADHQRQDRDDDGDYRTSDKEVRHVLSASLLDLRRRLGCCLWIYLAAGPDFLHALNDDAFARIETFQDDYVFVSFVAELDGAHRDGVLCIDDHYSLSALELLDGALWNKDRVLFFSNGDSQARKLSGAQVTARIG